MDFVVSVLQRFSAWILNKRHESCSRGRNEGANGCLSFTRDIAATKVEQVSAHARQHQHPLACVMEETHDRSGTRSQPATMAFVEARQKRHEFITVEHLLLALLDNPSAAEALRSWCAERRSMACAGPWELHRRAHPRSRAPKRNRHSAYPGLPAVIQRAILHVSPRVRSQVQQGQRPGGHLWRKDSHAVSFSRSAGRDPARRGEFISHGISKVPQQKAPAEGETETEGEQQQTGPLEQYPSISTLWPCRGKIDPLIGRDKELERVIQIPAAAGRTTPPRGRAGVGRPPSPRGWRVGWSKGRSGNPGQSQRPLDMGALLGRHQVSRRFRTATQRGFSRRSGDNVNAILFIDEIHTI